MSGGIGRRFIPLVLILVVVGVALAVTRVALAEPAAITQAKNEAQALRELIDELDAALEEANEDYNYATAKLAETVAAAERTAKKLSQAEADLKEAQERFNRRVVEIYKSGQVGVLDTLLGASSFSDLVNRFEFLTRLSKQDAELITQISDYREEVAARKAELDRQVVEQRQLKADAAAAKEKLAARLAAKEKALKGKEALIAQLEKEEAERQAALAAAARKAAEEAVRKAREEAAARARAATSTTTTVKRTTTTSGATTTTAKTTTTTAKITTTTAKTTTTTTESTTTTEDQGGSDPPADDEGSSSNDSGVTGADVVEYALKFLGTRYVWGGYSPSGFDCSGFTKYVYAHFDIYLPHSSRLQYGYGIAVSRSNLKMGDLLFFYSPISHVAIYIGNGKMVHAAGTGKGVRIDYIYSSYVGARRLIY